MWINGCHVLPFLDANGEEGFSAIVERNLITTATIDGKSEEVVTTIKRGPINSLSLAQKYAHEWSDAANPPPLPSPWVEPEKMNHEPPNNVDGPESAAEKGTVAENCITEKTTDSSVI